jgi:hypothetical protein
MRDTFPIIVLIGRPAAGKSEVIDYLKQTPVEDRRRRFHVGEFEEIDDFPILWERFEDDDIYERHGRPRQYTTSDYYFTEHFFWNFLIEKINLAFAKRLAADPRYLDDRTVVIEFSRGGETAFAEAFGLLSDDILKQAGIVYIDVSYEESVRKNRRRARPGMDDSILHHSLPDEKMEFYYRTNDWHVLTEGALDGTIPVRDHKVPFAVLPNEPEKTDDPAKLGPALEDAFGRLWKRTSSRSTAAPASPPVTAAR